MGITSFILSILALVLLTIKIPLISIIISIIALVLGIIAMVKKNQLGFSITATILSILGLIASIVFSVILGVVTIFNINNNLQISNKVENPIQSFFDQSLEQESVSAANISYTKIGVLPSGELVIKITNNNSYTVCIEKVQAAVYDSNNNYITTIDSTPTFLYLHPGISTYSYFKSLEYDLTKYSNYDFNASLETLENMVDIDKISSSQIANKDKILLTIHNNSDKNITGLAMVVVLFENNNVVGIIDNYVLDKISAGKDFTTELFYPVDKNHNIPKHDNVVVYITGATDMPPEFLDDDLENPIVD